VDGVLALIKNKVGWNNLDQDRGHGNEASVSTKGKELPG
jgi:hypothetical protein